MERSAGSLFACFIIKIIGAHLALYIVECEHAVGISALRFDGGGTLSGCRRAESRSNDAYRSAETRRSCSGDALPIPRIHDARRCFFHFVISRFNLIYYRADDNISHYSNVRSPILEKFNSLFCSEDEAGARARAGASGAHQFHSRRASRKTIDIASMPLVLQTTNNPRVIIN